MDIQKELYDTEQYKRISFLNDLKNCLEIFNRNSVELLKWIELGSNPERARHLFLLENRHKYQDFIYELSRHIHNYVASSYTLISVTHNVMKKYKKKGEERFFAEFENKKKELPTKPNYEIIYYLRQYYQHLNIPYLGSQYTANNVSGQETINFTLNRNEILSYNELSTTCKDYLQCLTSDEILIHEIIDNYNKLIYSFYDWVYNNLEIVLKEDMNLLITKNLK